MNRIVFLISFSIFLLLVYKKTSGYCTLIFILPSFWNRLSVSLIVFLVESLKSLMCRFISSAHCIKDTLTYLFSRLQGSISFSCLIAATETSRSLLTRSGENGE